MKTRLKLDPKEEQDEHTVWWGQISGIFSGLIFFKSAKSDLGFFPFSFLFFLMTFLRTKNLGNMVHLMFCGDLVEARVLWKLDRKSMI